MTGRLQHYVMGSVFMAVGTVSVLGFVVMLNELSQMPDRKPVEKVVEMVVEKAAKPKPKQELQKPRPKPKQVSKSPPPPSLAPLSAGLAGIEFDLPALRSADLGAGTGELLAGASEEVVHTSETVDSPPQPVGQEPMRYPPSLRKKGIEGYVVLSLLIGPSGEIERMKVLESKPPGTFDQTAMEGVKTWRFQPGTYQGQPVRTRVTQTVRFALR